MTDRYEKIRKALEMGPTPGPWKVGDQNGHCGISIGSDDALVAAAYLRLITSRAKWGEERFAMPENQEAVANATLIAACDPDTIRALLKERDALLAAQGEAKTRAEQLEEASQGWWKAHRPVGWTEDQHRSCPHVNLATDAEKALADALLRAREAGND